MANYDAYVICTSPRSGSTLLCSLLAATGAAGKPDSHFHRPSIDDWLAEYRIAPAAGASEPEVLDQILQAAIAEGRGGTPIFGLRLQRHSFDYFTGKLAVLFPERANDLERLEAAFGRTLFIHLTRPDKVDQAVSYVKAQQTGLWHMAPDGTELERLSPPREPVYDGVELKACFETMTAYDHQWEAWFEEQGIEPLRLSYEGLSEDPIAVLHRVLERLGLAPEVANGVELGVRKLADATNRDWVKRLRSELETA